MFHNTSPTKRWFELAFSLHKQLGFSYTQLELFGIPLALADLIALIRPSPQTIRECPKPLRS